jgi:hypothetical protein
VTQPSTTVTAALPPPPLPTNCWYNPQQQNDSIVVPVLCRPTFLIIGANKAGTSSLFHYLTQHPNVHASTQASTRSSEHKSKTNLKGSGGVSARDIQPRLVTKETQFFTTE